MQKQSPPPDRLCKPQYIPARAYVLLARDAPIGAVVRRGPSKRTCTLLWDLTNDTFQMGQWLKGRIFERESDLSPDGKYLIYYAANLKAIVGTKFR